MCCGPVCQCCGCKNLPLGDNSTALHEDESIDDMSDSSDSDSDMDDLEVETITDNFFP